MEIKHRVLLLLQWSTIVDVVTLLLHVVLGVVMVMARVVSVVLVEASRETMPNDDFPALGEMVHARNAMVMVTVANYTLSVYWALLELEQRAQPRLLTVSLRR
jgi:hypothetical protein